MLSLKELLAEVLPVLIRGGFLDNDLTVVVRQLEDDELVLLGKLEVVEGGYALLRNGGTGLLLAIRRLVVRRRTSGIVEIGQRLGIGGRVAKVLMCRATKAPMDTGPE